MIGSKNIPKIFDRKLLRQKRDKAAKHIYKYNFLHEKTANELTERIAPIDIKLPKILIWGGHTARLCQNLAMRKGTKNIYWADMSLALLKKNSGVLPPICSLVTADEEYSPFGKHSLDAVISNLTLHSVNDLKGALIQARHSLKPDRPFVAAIFGGDTLLELKKWLMQAEIEETNCASPRIFPFVDIMGLGGMLQNLGFVDPVIDSEVIDIEYSCFPEALADIRGMGETNILRQRDTSPISRSLILRADRDIKQRQLKISIEILYVIAWSP